MKLSIVVPVYNEERRISSNLSEIISYMNKKRLNHEIIIVNDGSTDNTLGILHKFNKKVKIISYEQNKGKGYAVKTGVLAAKGDRIFMCDADLAMPIAELDKFLKEKEDIVIGSRSLKGSEVKTTLFKKIMGRIGNLLISALIIRGIKDTQCGFKLFDKKCKRIFEKQTINRWGFDFEILFLARKFHYKIKEIPIKWTNMVGSKVELTDYPKTLFELLKIRFNDITGVYR